MKNLTLRNIVSACDGQYVGEEKLLDREIRGAVTDSRQIEPDYLFIPVKGERVDGHDFIPGVFEKGALATFSERPYVQCPGPYILVESSLAALKKLTAFYRSQLTIPIVGITGSVGKTSTKEMIASVLSAKYRVLKTAGNYNNEIGLPLTLLRICEEHEAAVVEMGISEFGEMHRLGEIAQPDICVLTNIGTCHLENLGDRDGVLRAKSEVFDHLRKNAFVFLNGDDDKLCTVESAGGRKPAFYGLGQQEIHMEDVENLGLKGSRAKLCTTAGDIMVEVPLPGRHNLYNAMAAAGVGLSLGLTLEEIRQGMAAAQTIAGRSNLIEANGLMIIDDCYNANPMSMKASLEVLSYGLQRKIAVLGDMGELGADEMRLHYEVGAYAAEKGIDVLFCAGELSEEIARGAKECGGCGQVQHYRNKEELLETLLEMVGTGDTILVKASHFMAFSEIVEALQKLKNME